MSAPDRQCSLDLRELQKREEEQLQVADVAIRRIYARRVKTALEKLHFRKQSEQFAENLVTGKTSLEEVLKNKDGKWQGIIKNACTDYQGLCDISFLLLNAPRKPFNDKMLDIGHDREAREHQLKHFYNILASKHDREKCPHDIKVVRTYSCLKAWIEEFIMSYASRSKRAIIVFNGHGKASGHLSLEDETENISNTDFVEDVHKAWDKLKQEHDEEGEKVVLPQRITIVLAHCYGYKYSQDDDHKDVIDVVCLTNKHNPETKYAYTFNTMGSHVKDSLHLQLTEYARRESLSEAQSPDSPSSVLTSATCAGECSKPCTTSLCRADIVTNLDGTFLACIEAFSAQDPQNGQQQTDTGITDKGASSQLTGIKRLNINITVKKLSDYFGKGKQGALDTMMASVLNLGQTPLRLTSTSPEAEHPLVTPRQLSLARDEKKKKEKKFKAKSSKSATSAAFKTVTDMTMVIGGFSSSGKGANQGSSITNKNHTGASACSSACQQGTVTKKGKAKSSQKAPGSSFCALVGSIVPVTNVAMHIQGAAMPNQEGVGGGASHN